MNLYTSCIVFLLVYVFSSTTAAPAATLGLETTSEPFTTNTLTTKVQDQTSKIITKEPTSKNIPEAPAATLPSKQTPVIPPPATEQPSGDEVQQNDTVTVNSTLTNVKLNEMNTTTLTVKPSATTVKHVSVKTTTITTTLKPETKDTTLAMGKVTTTSPESHQQSGGDQGKIEDDKTTKEMDKGQEEKETTKEMDKGQEEKETTKDNNKEQGEKVATKDNDEEIDATEHEAIDQNKEGQIQKTQKGMNHDYGEGESSPGAGHFMAYFLTAVVLCVAGYVIFHNKQKIVAFIVEGRNGRRGPRRPNKSGYKKLSPSGDDVLPKLEKSTSSSQYIY